MSYRVYGLSLASEEPLPELDPTLAAAVDEPDVRFRRAASSRPCSAPGRWFMHWRLPSGEPWLSAARRTEGFLLRFHDRADFVVDSRGGEVVCRSWCDNAPETMRHLLIDHVLPLLVNLRGAESLHASAVLTDRGVVAFTGPSGSGKSTLAAELARSGNSLIADDCVRLIDGDDGFDVSPAYPGLRLWSDALLHLDLDGGAGEAVADYTDKRRIVLDHAAAAPGARYPLAAIFVLDDGSGTGPEATVCRLPLRKAVMALIRSAFRFEVDDRAMLQRQLVFHTRLAESVPVRGVSAPRDLQRLPDVRREILRTL